MDLATLTPGYFSRRRSNEIRLAEKVDHKKLLQAQRLPQLHIQESGHGMPDPAVVIHLISTIVEKGKNE